MRERIARTDHKVIIPEKRYIVADTGEEGFYLGQEIILRLLIEEEINLEATGKVRSRRHLYDSLCIRMRQREANRGVHRDLFVSFSPIFH